MTASPEQHILLIIGGGIAAYKTLDLIRRLRERGFLVRAVMTAAAQHFVTKLAVESLTGNKVFDDLFALTENSSMGHIELSRDADLPVVAPATADILGRRREIVEHPFGSIKQWMNQGAFLMRGLDNVRAEFSLTALVYKLRRALNILGVETMMAAMTA